MKQVHLNGPAAAEEGDKEDDATDHDKKDRGVEELIPQEVQVLAESNTQKLTPIPGPPTPHETIAHP